jgi:hypothetical protein
MLLVREAGVHIVVGHQLSTLRAGPARVPATWSPRPAVPFQPGQKTHIVSCFSDPEPDRPTWSTKFLLTKKCRNNTLDGWRLSRGLNIFFIGLRNFFVSAVNCLEFLSSRTNELQFLSRGAIM